MLAESSLHDLFEEQVKRTPNAVAVVYGREEYTYGELNERANRIAKYLRNLGAGPDIFVGVCIERSLDLVAALVGIVKSGAAYVPLDPAYPAERLQWLIEDSRATIVLTTAGYEPRVPRVGRTRIVAIDSDISHVPVIAGVEPWAEPHDAAYVIYTSGSTGVPKGVVVEHRQVTRLFSSTTPWFGFGPKDVWTMFHSYGFDFSVWEMWGALLHGGKLVVVPSSTSRDPDAFYDLLAREQVTVLNQTPTAFHQLSRVEEVRGKQGLLALRWIIFGGEALDPQTLRGWIARHGDSQPQLINMFGITETTVHVTYQPIKRADTECAGKSPIGVPLPDLRVYLLDENARPVKQGSPGEIYVGGAGVARGYWNRPELNAQRFLPDPFCPGGGKMYRSGDLAVADEHGVLNHIGRADAQLKIRGFRIEPGEVESCMRRNPKVADVTVVGRDYGAGDKRLIAYVVPAFSAQHTDLSEELKAVALQYLPEHMRPQSYVVLSALPLNANGKVDRKALPAPEDVITNADSRRTASSELEKAVAKIWAEVVGSESIGLDDDFFDVGGTSLGAIKVLLAIQQRFGRSLDMSVWANTATIAQFVELLSQPEMLERKAS